MLVGGAVVTFTLNLTFTLGSEERKSGWNENDGEESYEKVGKYRSSVIVTVLCHFEEKRRVLIVGWISISTMTATISYWNDIPLNVNSIIIYYFRVLWIHRPL